MGNMKYQHKLTVAFGDIIEDVLCFTAKDYSMDIDLENGEIDLATINDERKYAYYVPYNPDDVVPRYTRFNALASLHDHINNVPEEELTAVCVNDDYFCSSPDHINNNICCQASQDDCVLVSVYNFTYYAQDCIVDCYYVKQA